MRVAFMSHTAPSCCPQSSKTVPIKWRQIKGQPVHLQTLVGLGPSRGSVRPCHLATCPVAALVTGFAEPDRELIGLLSLDVARADHLAPLFDFIGEKLAVVCGRT
jgi:hypothetical protein